MNTTTPLGAFRILVIDDTPTIHDDFRKILTPAAKRTPAMDALAAAIFGKDSPTPPPVRFELDSAVQGHTGLALVQDAVADGQPYAVAFVDMRMPPGWDGLETIRHLWAADPHLQIVICTAYSDHSWAMITERLGQSDNLLILKKPFDNVEVLQITHSLTRKWCLAHEVKAHVARLDDQLRTRTAELRRSEEGVTSVFEASPLAQAIVSLENPVVITVNPAFEKIMGLAKAEAASFTSDCSGRDVDPQSWNELIARPASGAAIDDHACVFRSSTGRKLNVRGRVALNWE